MASVDDSKPFYPTQAKPNWIFLGRFRKHFHDNFAWDLYISDDEKNIICVYGSEYYHYSVYPIEICREMAEKGTFFGRKITGEGLNNPRIEAYKQYIKWKEKQNGQSQLPENGYSNTN